MLRWPHHLNIVCKYYLNIVNYRINSIPTSVVSLLVHNLPWALCNLASQWQTAHYLASPMEILNCLKFPPLISAPGAYTDNSAHAHINF